MTSRSDMDRPATVFAALLGVVLIAVSLPFLVANEGDQTSYTISWTAQLHGSAQANAATAAGSVAQVSVPVNDAQAALATIEVTACTDGFTAPVQSPATLTWRLFQGTSSTPLEDGTATCASRAPVEVTLNAHADVGSVAAASAHAAEQEAYDAGTNATTSYRIEFSWSRPASAGGLPLPDPGFSATVKLTVDEWVATANAADEEVVR